MKKFLILFICFSLLFSSLGGSVLADEVGTESTNDTEIPAASDVPDLPAASDPVSADDEAAEDPIQAAPDYTEVLANIQGYLLFFVVVILLYFSYKFFRMFF